MAFPRAFYRSDLPRLAKKPVRMCRTLHFCGLCEKDITAGERYHDGGYGMRAHVTCVANPPDWALGRRA